MNIRDLCVLIVLDDVYRQGSTTAAVLARRVENNNGAAVVGEHIAHAIREASERRELAHDASGLVRITPKGLQVLREQRERWRQLLPGLRRAVA